MRLLRALGYQCGNSGHSESPALCLRPCWLLQGLRGPFLSHTYPPHGTVVEKPPYTLEEGMVPARCPAGQGKIEKQGLKTEKCAFYWEKFQNYVQVETTSDHFVLNPDAITNTLLFWFYPVPHTFFSPPTFL